MASTSRWHRPLKMASTVYERENCVAATLPLWISPISINDISLTAPNLNIFGLLVDWVDESNLPYYRKLTLVLTYIKFTGL